MNILKLLRFSAALLVGAFFLCSASLPIGDSPAISATSSIGISSAAFDPPPVETKKAKKHRQKRQKKRKIKRAKQQQNNLAFSIVALVLGVISAVSTIMMIVGSVFGGFIGLLITAGIATVFSLMAIIFGAIALGGIKKGQEGRIGLALPGMILGIVVLSIMVIFWLIYLLVLAIAGVI